MSVIEDIRKVIQDLVAPELKSVVERLDGLEKTLNARFDGLERSLVARMDGTDTTHAAQIALLTATIAANHAAVLHALDIDKRLERLEGRSVPPSSEAAPAA